MIGRGHVLDCVQNVVVHFEQIHIVRPEICRRQVQTIELGQIVLVELVALDLLVVEFEFAHVHTHVAYERLGCRLVAGRVKAAYELI